MTKPSKFAGLGSMQALRAARLGEETVASEPSPLPPAPTPTPPGPGTEPTLENLFTGEITPPEPAYTEQPSARGPGRPAGGKRGNPEYRAIMGYIPEGLDREVRIRMAQNRVREFSDVLEQALQNWLDQTQA